MGNVYSESRLCKCPPPPPENRLLASNSDLVGTRAKMKGLNYSSPEELTPASPAASTTYTKRKGSLESMADAFRKGRGRARSRNLSTGSGDISSEDDNSRAEPSKGRGRGRSLRTSVSVEFESVVQTSIDMNNSLQQSLQEISSRLETISLVLSTSGIGKSDKEVQTQKDDAAAELPKHVLYYGWFMTPEISDKLHNVVMHLFKLCFEEVPQFQRFILSCCSVNDIRDPFELYKRPGKRVKPDDEIKYHITAKFIGRVQNVDYQTPVIPFVGRTFQIHLIGMVFTPRTLGVRVKLTPAQQLLFDEKDEHRTGRKLSFKAEDIRAGIQNELKSYKQAAHKKGIGMACKIKSHDIHNIIFKSLPTLPSPEPLTTSRAHITIGVAPKVQAKQTGDDLVDIVDLESRAAGSCNFQQDFKIKNGTLRQFGRHADAFVLYPDVEMLVPATFNYFI